MVEEAGVEAYLLSGAGNDFIGLVEPIHPPEPAAIRAWCTRGVSVGADGVFSIARQEAARGSVRMVYWNADGGRSDLCLNGSRCAAQLAYVMGWVNGELALETDVGILTARRVDEEAIEVDLPSIAEAAEALSLATPSTPGVSTPVSGWRVDVGVPHFVVPWTTNLAQAPVARLGPILRGHPDLGPDGANVHFVRFDSVSELEIRSFERGVEAETLACGTGAVAAVATGVAVMKVSPPARVRTASGYCLRVAGEVVASGTSSAMPTLGRISLAGDARVLARCAVFDAARSVPDGPQWSP